MIVQLLVKVHQMTVLGLFRCFIVGQIEIIAIYKTEVDKKEASEKRGNEWYG
jgi:hypothetical protein